MTPEQIAAVRMALGALQKLGDASDKDVSHRKWTEAKGWEAIEALEGLLSGALMVQPAQQAAEPVDRDVAYGDGGYACCEGGPCAADVHNASLSDRHMDAIKPFTADVMRIIRDAGMTFHLGLPHDKVIEQMTRVVDLAYAEASIKAAVVFSAPAQQPLTDEHVTDGSQCWCDPELDYKDPDTGAEVWVHRGKQ